MLKFRPYQETAFADCVKFLEDEKDYKKSVVVAPTGAGKAILIGALANYIKTPLLVLQPSKELLTQNREKLEVFGGESTVFSASLGEKEISHTTFATPKSILPHIQRFINLGVKHVIIDEAQLQCKPGSIIDEIIDKLGKKIKVIGLTGTPIILRQGIYGSELKMLNRTRDSIFTQIIHVTQIKELTDNGYWSDLIYEVRKQRMDSLKLNTTGSDFTDESVNIFYSENAIIDQLVETHAKLSKERKSILIFVSSISAAEELRDKINKKNCEVVHSKLGDKQRDLVIRLFRENKLQTLINIGVAGVGFDKPDLDCILYAAPTNSFGRYSQYLGRGVRIHPNKKDCLIVDFAGNIERFGRVEDTTYEDLPGYGWGCFINEYCVTSQPLCLPKLKREQLAKKVVEKIDNPRLLFGDNPPFTFGKYKGKTIKEVFEKDSKYLSWLVSAEDFNWKWLKGGEDFKKQIVDLLYKASF